MLEHVVGSDGSLVCVATENMKYCTYDLPSKKMIICFANNKEKDKEDTYVIPMTAKIYMDFVKRTSRPLTDEEIRLLSQETLSLAVAKKSFNMFARYLKMRGLTAHTLFESEDAVLYDAFKYISCTPETLSIRKQDDSSVYITEYIQAALYASSSVTGGASVDARESDTLNVYDGRTGYSRLFNGTAVLYSLVRGDAYFDIAFKVIPIVGDNCSIDGKAESLMSYLKNIKDVGDAIYRDLIRIIYKCIQTYSGTVKWLAPHALAFIHQLKSIEDVNDLDSEVTEQLGMILRRCVSALEDNGYVFEKETETAGCAWLEFLD